MEQNTTGFQGLYGQHVSLELKYLQVSFGGMLEVAYIP